ncbi:MAG: AMIN domain-containing protein, partial [Proteobacteria bacterium]|nr:AMIN domain-containing protein [Pseudomonadota bacterium]
MPRNSPLAIFALLALLLSLATPAGAQDESAVFKQAKTDYAWLLEHPKAQKVPSNWQVLADRFARVYKSDPNGPLAPKAMYWTARIHSVAFFRFKQQSDLNEAVDLYRRLSKRFPKSPLADDAQFKIARLYEKTGDLKRAYVEYLRVTMNHPNGDMVAETRRRLDVLERELAPKPAQTGAKTNPGEASVAGGTAPDPKASTSPLISVTQVKHWSTPTYTRVVAALDRPVPYTANLLKSNLSVNKPRRLYVDLRGARLADSVKETVPIQDGLLLRARAGQFNPSTVRMVLDIKHLASYKVFTLDNPFRVVVDCFGKVVKGHAKTGKLKVHKVKRGRAQQDPPELGLAAALGLKLRRIVLDPGHGGKDQGCSHGRLKEKDITLDIALRTAPILAKTLGC